MSTGKIISIKILITAQPGGSSSLCRLSSVEFEASWFEHDLTFTLVTFSRRALPLQVQLHERNRRFGPARPRRFPLRLCAGYGTESCLKMVMTIQRLP